MPVSNPLFKCYTFTCRGIAIIKLLSGEYETGRYRDELLCKTCFEDQYDRLKQKLVDGDAWCVIQKPSP